MVSTSPNDSPIKSPIPSMSHLNQKKQDSSEENVEKNQGPKEEKSLQEKLKESDDKLLR